jgi:hypothetical protein
VEFNISVPSLQELSQDYETASASFCTHRVVKHKDNERRNGNGNPRFVWCLECEQLANEMQHCANDYAHDHNHLEAR